MAFFFKHLSVYTTYQHLRIAWERREEHTGAEVHSPPFTGEGNCHPLPQASVAEAWSYWGFVALLSLHTESFPRVKSYLRNMIEAFIALPGTDNE